MNYYLNLVWLLIGYTIVTIIGIIHTIINWKVFKIDSPKNIKASRVPAYKATERFHPLYNFFIFPICAYMYLTNTTSSNIYHEALITGLTWMIITIIVDLIGWVLIKHPWQMTYKEMYVEYQPWITLIYIIIFASPFIAILFM